jgi:hypothetical protein
MRVRREAPHFLIASQELLLNPAQLPSAARPSHAPPRLRKQYCNVAMPLHFRHHPRARRQKRMLQRRSSPTSASGGGHNRDTQKIIDALRAAANAYQRWYRRSRKSGRESSRRSDGTNPAHSDGSTGGPLPGGSDAATAATALDNALLSALRKDYSAWVVYNRDGRLPERVYSEGMDLSALGRQVDASWLDYLTPDERARANAARADYQEYVRLGLKDKARRAAWLAGANTALGAAAAADDAASDAGAGRAASSAVSPRSALYERLHAAYAEYVNLYSAGRRARQQGRPRGSTDFTVHDSSWQTYLTPEQRARVEALRPSYNQYVNLGLHVRASRDEWLAAAAGEGEKQARQERFRQLHQAYLERQRLYRAAHGARERLEQGSSAAAMSRRTRAGAGGGKSWVDYLSPRERARVKALRPAYNEYVRLGLNRVATRDAWLAEDPDHASERRTKYEQLRALYSEHHRLYGKGRRSKEKAKSSPPETGDNMQSQESEHGDRAMLDHQQDASPKYGATAADEMRQNFGEYAMRVRATFSITAVDEEARKSSALEKPPVVGGV